ncbi:Hypothetical protein CpATCC19410_0416 [Corynebacterium pseudotuberculosis]|nr:Hypothetical protein CpATCC19410_0416 [Corynebacterium pseudotuberculosis]
MKNTATKKLIDAPLNPLTAHRGGPGPTSVPHLADEAGWSSRSLLPRYSVVSRVQLALRDTTGVREPHGISVQAVVVPNIP